MSKIELVLHLFSMYFFDKTHRLLYMIFFEFFDYFFLNWNKTIMVGDTLNLRTHSIQEIKFYITFIRSTFLIRLTVYEILRVFWKIVVENTQAPYYSRCPPPVDVCILRSRPKSTWNSSGRWLATISEWCRDSVTLGTFPKWPRPFQNFEKIKIFCFNSKLDLLGIKRSVMIR